MLQQVSPVVGRALVASSWLAGPTEGVLPVHQSVSQVRNVQRHNPVPRLELELGSSADGSRGGPASSQGPACHACSSPGSLGTAGNLPASTASFSILCLHLPQQLGCIQVSWIEE